MDKMVTGDFGHLHSSGEIAYHHLEFITATFPGGFMQRTNSLSRLSFTMLLLLLLSSACSTFAPPAPTSTSTPRPTATKTATPTRTARPTSTPKPTKTPNLAATQHMSDLQAEAQTYFDEGYLASADGKFMEYDDFDEKWAQLGWYSWWTLDQNAKDFYMSAHFKVDKRLPQCGSLRLWICVCHSGR